MSNESKEQPRFVTCDCQVCNGRIEFDANELAGRDEATVECPHCTLETIIFVPRPTTTFPRPIEDASPAPAIISDFRLRQISDVEREEFLRKENAERSRTAEAADQTPSERGPLYVKVMEDLRAKEQPPSAEQSQPTEILEPCLPEPVAEAPSEIERLTPIQFSDFIGQTRVKARLELAIAAAKSRDEALPHVLLVGSAGLGKATLANIIANRIGFNMKSASGQNIGKASDFAGLVTNLEEGDVLFIDEIQLLPKSIDEYLRPAMADFKLDIFVDTGKNPRNVRLSLPRFTLIGTTPRPERLSRNLLSLFPIVESLDAYTSEDLIAIGHRFSCALNLEIDEASVARVARSSDGAPIDILNRLKHVRDFAHVKGENTITLEVADLALKMLVTHSEKQVANESRDAIPMEVRREVWRRDGGKCVKCGSRERLEFDHIIPVAKGGSNTARNIELLCENCNRAKSATIQ